jgi:hypothetical protein
MPLSCKGYVPWNHKIATDGELIKDVACLKVLSHHSPGVARRHIKVEIESSRYLGRDLNPGSFSQKALITELQLSPKFLM